VGALGCQSGMSKSQMNRFCQEIDQQVKAFLARPLESSGYASVTLDATHLKGRLGTVQQICSRTVVVSLKGDDKKTDAVLRCSAPPTKYGVSMASGWRRVTPTPGCEGHPPQRLVRPCRQTLNADAPYQEGGLARVRKQRQRGSLASQ
jgi:hypothetical protein